MGKRELLIIAAFFVLGAATWRLTAPPSPPGGRSFSLDTLSEIWRNRNSPRPAGHAVMTTHGTIEVTAALSEVRLSSVFEVIVEGGERTDIAWSLDAEARGPTDDAARQAAERIRLEHDDLGTVVAMWVRGPDDAPRTSTLTLQVPSRLAVRVESARRTRISSVAGVRLENLVGDADLKRITGGISGAHRNGQLSIDDVRDVTLALIGSTAVIRRPLGAVSLSARNGSTRIEQPAGAVVAEATNQDLTIVDSLGNVRVGGLGGEITIERPRAAIDVDARRTRVMLRLDRAVPATVFSAEGGVTLTLDDGPLVSLDVIADAGKIDAQRVGLTPVDRDGHSHLVQSIDGAARVAIRGERSNIVIAPGK
jgi:hypothetical protein